MKKKKKKDDDDDKGEADAINEKRGPLGGPVVADAMDLDESKRD